MIVIFLFIIGLCVGSFLNVLIDRIPREEPFVREHSHCEYCKKQLQWFDLIPLLSFVLIRGKCRYCKRTLSWYYPFLELVTAVLFVSTYYLLPNLPLFSQDPLHFIVQISYSLFILSTVIVVFFIDLKHGIIPFSIVLAGVAASCLYFLFFPSLFFNHLLTAIGSLLFFLMIFLLTKRKGIGFGDVIFAFLIGLIVGYPRIIISLYAAFLLGACISVLLIFLRKKRFHGGSVPFGPFLVIGTIAGMFFANTFTQVIVQLLHLP